MAGVGHAQSSSNRQAATRLPEVVVTASRTPHDVHSEPATVYRLSATEQTTLEGARTTPDMLKGIPSAFVQKTGYGQGSPYLRGFTGFRTLSLIDGIRLNNSVFRDGPNQYWNTVDPLSIRDYELVMGPASVLYGSDAIGGALNALPLQPPDHAGAPVWEKRLYYRGASADGSSVGRAQLGSRLNETVGFVGGVTIKDFGDLRGGDGVGEQEHTGYRERDYDARVDTHVDKDSTLTIAHQTVSQDDAWRTHRTIYGIDWEGLTKGDDKVNTYDQDRHLTYTKFRADHLNNGVVDNLEATVSHQVQSEDNYRVKKDDTGEQQGFDVTTWGAAAQLESDTAAGRWVYGTEYYHDSVDSYGVKYKADGSLQKREIQGPVAGEASYDSVGVYVADNLSLFDGQLDVIPGARWTFARADADKVKDPLSSGVMSVDGDWDALVGSLRLLHPLTADRRHVVFAGASQGFRAPNLSDLTRLDIARSTEIETPVSELDPESFVAYEIGLKSRFEHLTSRIGYYYTVIDEMITRAPTGRTIDGLTEVTKKNSGDGYIQGLEASETYRFNTEWSSWVTAAWMDGEVDAYPTSAATEQRDYVSRLMPLTTQVGVRWQQESGRYWAEACGDIAARADRLSADDKRDTQRIPPGGTPGYAVCTVRTGSQVTRQLGVTVALENVFDEDYRIHGSGVNEPGRNLVLTLAYDF
jgi:hemoglobin/transferrin/lactoferrin receptor protein